MTSLGAVCEQLSVHPDALVLGAGRSSLATGLSERGTAVHAVSGVWPSIQLARRYPLVIVEPSDPHDDRAAIVHCAAQHAEPGGVVVLIGADDAELAGRFDLREFAAVASGGSTIRLCWRTERTTIHDMVFAARARISRLMPLDLAARLRERHPPIVVDTRTATDRHRFGVIDGSIHVPRTVVEWHLDPANGYRHPEVVSLDQPLVLVCNGGYSSSLAAANLLDLGFTDVGDLVGGVRAWIDAGLPVVAPDHTHLDV